MKLHHGVQVIRPSLYRAAWLEADFFWNETYDEPYCHQLCS